MSRTNDNEKYRSGMKKQQQYEIFKNQNDYSTKKSNFNIENGSCSGTVATAANYNYSSSQQEELAFSPRNQEQYTTATTSTARFEDSSPWDVDTSEQVYLQSSNKDVDTRPNDVAPRKTKKTLLPSASLNTGLQMRHVMNHHTGTLQSSSSMSNIVQLQNEADTLNERNGVIDSALLSALNDPKERMGLLRLEQVLIEFMNDRTVPYIDVGGSNNSSIIRAYSNNTGGGAVVGRQTSFQRLCLHRLADRFNIVREVLAPSSEDYYGGGGGMTPSLIRLIKMKNSRIPSKLLIDIDVQQHLADNQKFEEGTTTVKAESMRNLTESFSGMTTATLPKSESRRKMKIMTRRSESGNSIGGSGADGKEKKHGRKGKKQSEKEKAYAEARARIFNEMEERRRAELAASTGLTSTSSGSSPPPSTKEMGFQNPDSPGISSELNELDRFVVPDHYEVEESEASFDRRKSFKELNKNGTNNSSSSVSKVTWRNRRQEENDPDFRRGVVRSVAQSQPVYMTAAPPVFVSSAPQPYPMPPDYPIMQQSSKYHTQQQQMYYPLMQQQQQPYQAQQYYPRRHYQGQQMYHGGSSNGHPNASSGKDESIVYSIEEFPALR